MAKIKKLFLTCGYCETSFPSPIFIGDTNTLDSSVLTGNTAQCPTCKRMIHCNRENMSYILEGSADVMRGTNSQGNKLDLVKGWSPANQEKPPGLLFRYHSLATDIFRARSEAAICSSRLYFGQPSKFNDPFDCVPAVSDEASEEMILAFLHQLGADEGLSSEEASRRAHEGLQTFLGQDPATRKMRRRKAKAFLDSYLEQSGVVCFSASPAPPVLWGHYAHGHRGICIAYRAPVIQALSDGVVIFIKVTYTKHRPVANVFDLQLEHRIGEVTIGSKHAAWEYEQEWRLVLLSPLIEGWERNGGRRELDFQKSSGVRHRPVVAGVILGARIATEDVAYVRSWCALTSPATPICKAKLSEQEYDVATLGIDQWV